MSKSILVIDTPECCDYCPVGRIFGMAGQVECMEGKDVRVNNNGRTIPDWCPLLDLPERMKYNNIIPISKQHSVDYMNGYNACIDEILKGKNENDEGTV